MSNQRVFDVEGLIRPAVRSIPSYEPPKVDMTGIPRFVKLDWNESPYGPSPKTRAALAAFDETHRYPPFDARELRVAIGKYIQADPDQIVCGSGLDDVLNTLCLALLDPGDEIMIHEPTFGVYRALAAHYGASVIDVPLLPDFSLNVDGMLASVTDRTKLIIICNPNNPTGNILDLASIERVAAEAPCFVMIDEAYAEFAGIGHRHLMEKYPNVMIGRTMSKFAGLAGMRVGYGVFPAAFMPYLRQVTPAFHNVSNSGTAATIASLNDLEYLDGIVARINSDRDTLAANLREFPGVTPLPSGTNFLLVRLPVENAGPIVAELARRGIFVRHFGKPELGIADCLRVSIGTADDNDLFLAELGDILESQGK